MDLSKAVEAHVQWKTKFRVALQKHETLDATSIAKDNCCELGKWLHGDGKKSHGALPSFGDVVSKHAAFHTVAGQIATVINNKKFAEAEQMLANGKPFSDASAAVGVALTKLKLDAKL